MSRPSSSNSNTVSVYAGRQFLGSVERRDDSFVAINTDGVVVGRFETLREAIGAFEEAVS
jgi:hypothetical protein